MIMENVISLVLSKLCASYLTFFSFSPDTWRSVPPFYSGIPTPGLELVVFCFPFLQEPYMISQALRMFMVGSYVMLQDHLRILHDHSRILHDHSRILHDLTRIM